MSWKHNFLTKKTHLMFDPRALIFCCYFYRFILAKNQKKRREVGIWKGTRRLFFKVSAASKREEQSIFKLLQVRFARWLRFLHKSRKLKVGCELKLDAERALWRLQFVLLIEELNFDMLRRCLVAYIFDLRGNRQ